MTAEPTTTTLSLDWLVSSFTDDVSGVTHTALVSADGLPVAASEGLPAERADRLAAVAAGLASLTASAADLFAGGLVVQSVIEMQHGFLLLMSIGDGSHLVVLADPRCDIGLVGYEMTLLVQRVGRVLDTPVRGARP
jgi:predicted regulator of Ras-like GTPase activity (Roadblock/LC7/MglB family)